MKIIFVFNMVEIFVMSEESNQWLHGTVLIIEKFKPHPTIRLTPYNYQWLWIFDWTGAPDACVKLWEKSGVNKKLCQTYGTVEGTDGEAQCDSPVM